MKFRLCTRAQIVVRAVRRFMPEGPIRLLDVGCAEGRALTRIANSLECSECIGVEYCDALREAHPPLPKQVRLIPGNAMSLPDELHEETFHVVSILAVLEHLPRPKRALTEARRMLRPDGLVIATCPNPWWSAAAEMFRMERSLHHVNMFKLERLAGLVRSAGFEVVSARRFMWAPISVLPYLGITPPVGLALDVDAVVGRIPLLRDLCVNACVVARRP